VLYKTLIYLFIIPTASFFFFNLFALLSPLLKKTVLFVVHLQPTTGTGYRCVINTGSAVYQATGELLDDRHITCSMPEMIYGDVQGMLAADLSVYWGNDFYLESSKGLLGMS
jgi:hypothetical protein